MYEHKINTYTGEPTTVSHSIYADGELFFTTNMMAKDTEREHAVRASLELLVDVLNATDADE